MSTERTLDKIRKLKAHMESAKKIGSDKEAEAFAAMMQRLMLEHNISMTDLDVEKMEADEPVGTFTINPDGPGAKAKRARSYWIEDLATIIARAHFCRVLIYESSSLLCLVGRRSNVEVAEFMIVTMARLIHKMALREWWKEWRRRGGDESYERNRAVRQELLGFRVSYVKSFTQRLAERYYEERQRATQGDGKSTALVRVNRAEAAVTAFFNENYSNAKAAKAVTKYKDTTHAAGWRAGREAADQIDLRAGSKAVQTKEQEALAQPLCASKRCYRHETPKDTNKKVTDLTCDVCKEIIVNGAPTHSYVSMGTLTGINRHCACDRQLNS